MLGRGAQGAPWRLAQIAHALFAAPAPVVPRGADLADLIVEHYQLILGFYGRDLGLRVARKHLGWYLDEAGLTAQRDPILTSTDPEQVIRLIRATFAQAQEVAA